MYVCLLVRLKCGPEPAPGTWRLGRQGQRVGTLVAGQAQATYNSSQDSSGGMAGMLGVADE